MTVTDYQIEIPGLVIGPGTPYILTGWDGYGVPSMRTSDDPAPQADGVWTGPDYLDGRNLTLRVTARGDTPEAAVAAAEALIAAWHLDTVQDGYRARLPLTLKMPGLAPRVIFGRPRRATFAVERIVGGNVSGTLEFFCPEPLWRSADEWSQALTLAAATTGRSYNRGYDYGYGGSVTSDAAVCVNNGSRAVSPGIVIQGPVTNPRIQSLTADATLWFQITLGAGEELHINFEERTVRLGANGASRYNTKRGDWFMLAPGANTLRFGSASYSSGASATVSWRDAWA